MPSTSTPSLEHHLDPLPGMEQDGLSACERALQILDAYLDQEVAGPERQQIDAHLEECKSCMKQLKFEESFLDMMRKGLRLEDMDRSRLEAMRDRIAAATMAFA